MAIAQYLATEDREWPWEADRLKPSLLITPAQR